VVFLSWTRMSKLETGGYAAYWNDMIDIGEYEL
jgi:hypothetical protein